MNEASVLAMARAFGRQRQSSELIEADLTARLNDDGVTSVKVTDTDTVNLVWAKLLGSDERIVQAYNGRVQPRDKAPVWVRRLADGTYEIEGIRSRDGSDFYGEALATMNIGELIGELMATVWGARNLKPGRARLSELGGMNLYIEAFFHSAGFFPGDNIDLASYVPATTDMQAWAKVWYDPIGDTLGATVGTEYGLAYTLTEVDLGAVSIPASYIPLAGVLLQEGDTTLSGNSIIVAAQNWIDAPVTSEMFFPVIVTDARVIPTNRQLVISQTTIDTGGSIEIDGILRIIG